MLEFQNVVFQYDVEDFNIIDGLSFHIQKGEFVSVIGPSGCGKSTIFRLTNQLLPRRSGEILVDGKSITDQCIGWDTTVEVLETLAAAVRKRRAKRQEA